MVNKDPGLLWLLSPSLFFTDSSLCAAIRADKTDQKWVCISAGGHHSPLSHLSTTWVGPPRMNRKKSLAHSHTRTVLSLHLWQFTVANHNHSLGANDFTSCLSVTCPTVQQSVCVCVCESSLSPPFTPVDGRHSDG